MKEAQDFRVGNVVKMNGNLMVIQKAIYNKGGRGASTVSLKFKNIETNNSTESVYRASDKLEEAILESREMAYSYFDGEMYVFMDKETFDQVSVTEDLIGEYMPYIREQVEVTISFYEGRPISISFPTFVVAEITYTEPAVRGDTTGKVMKKAKVDTGYEFSVPAFCEIGDKIRIDTRTHEYADRVK